MKISVVGAGKAGRTIARLLKNSGHEIVEVVCTSRSSAAEAVRFVGAGSPSTSIRHSEFDILIIGVPDGSIAGVARKVASAIPNGKSRIAFHLSGTNTVEDLQPLKKNGFAVASVHPLKSFANPEIAAKTFGGTFCAIEADSKQFPILSGLVSGIGGIPFRVSGDKKRLYHAAAVFASNYLCAIISVAAELMRESGVSPKIARDAVLKLTGGTFDNIRNLWLPEALTGPIERGDVETVKIHISALKKYNKRLATLYSELGLQTLQIAEKKGLRGKLASQIERVLSK